MGNIAIAIAIAILIRLSHPIHIIIHVLILIIRLRNFSKGIPNRKTKISSVSEKEGLITDLIDGVARFPIHGSEDIVVVNGQSELFYSFRNTGAGREDSLLYDGSSVTFADTKKVDVEMGSGGECEAIARVKI